MLANVIGMIERDGMEYHLSNMNGKPTACVKPKGGEWSAAFQGNTPDAALLAAYDAVRVKPGSDVPEVGG